MTAEGIVNQFTHHEDVLGEVTLCPIVSIHILQVIPNIVHTRFLFLLALIIFV